MESLKKIAPLLKQPSFSAADAKQLGVSSSLLCHYVKKGVICRLARGIYRSCDFHFPLETTAYEELIEAISVIPTGVICLLSALDLYGLTEEIPRNIWIAIPHATTSRKPPHSQILRFRNITIGKTTILIHGIRVPIFDVERTIIDSFRLLSREIAIKSLKMALSTGQVNLVKLQQYSKKLQVNLTPYILSLTT